MCKQESVAEHCINVLEDIKDDNRLVLEQLKQSYPEFFKWIEGLGRFGVNLIDGAVLRYFDDRQTYRVQFFTRENCYSISMRAPVDEYKAYLGCVVSSRTPLAGEDWTRGRDLADGPFSQETWHKIVIDILAHELVRLGC